MFIRSKVVKGNTYYQVVRGYRDGRRVRHRTLASLGQHPTIEAALAATKRELRKVAREAERERQLWPASTERPLRSARRLALLERRLSDLDAQRHRLALLLTGAAVDTTTSVPSVLPWETVVGTVGNDRASLIGMNNGRVDVVTTVRGKSQTTWQVRADEVEATLRAHGFCLKAATWSRDD